MRFVEATRGGLCTSTATISVVLLALSFRLFDIPLPTPQTASQSDANTTGPRDQRKHTHKHTHTRRSLSTARTADPVAAPPAEKNKGRFVRAAFARSNQEVKSLSHPRIQCPGVPRETTAFARHALLSSTLRRARPRISPFRISVATTPALPQARELGLGPSRSVGATLRTRQAAFPVPSSVGADALPLTHAVACWITPPPFPLSNHAL
jgi:hypothetical protein